MKMGIIEENGMENIGLKNIKNKYRRMDSDLSVISENEAHILRKRSTRKFVMASAVFASLNSVLLGYDVGVMSGAVIFIQEDLKISDVQIEVLIGILSIISLLGSLAGGKTSDTIGRKWTMALAATIFQVGAGIMALAPNFGVLLAGRLFAGVGIGFGVMIAPVYIAEIAPAIARGSLTSFPEIFINFGILLGYISNYVFSGLPAHINWRIMLGVGILPSIFIGGALLIIPESPRCLVMQNHIDEAKVVLQKTIDNEKEVEEKLADIQQAAGTTNADKYETKAVWQELLHPTPAVRKMLIAGCGIQIFQQITGIDTVVYYSPTIFKDAGISSNTELLAATMAVGFTKTFSILIAIFLIDHLGRKPLLYVSTVGMTVCLIGLSLSLALLGHEPIGIRLALLFVCGNVAFFSVGIGPICWVLSSEIFPLRLRAQASGLGAVGSRLSSGLISMSFLSAAHAITVAGTFFVFAVISALSIVFVYKCVPETRGKSLEEIEVMFDEDKHPGSGEMELADTASLVPKEPNGA
ncbi:probable polyol transporter 4 isoform X1 [Chenopodium quinoa]|uniref:Major facilitator superfamily (MFS) profile domain-containing protein n=2 Tax=Chenopodium quinoa TaxID=63459 RepID=A0A803LPU1_CHEQI|nr:probable polyol transporter 4 isoform X1 [Chenopodium quinoa]